jgi:hypothetical protein
MAPTDRIEELLDRWEELRERGREPTPEELCCDSPEVLDEVRRRITVLRSLAWLERPEGDAPGLTPVSTGDSPVGPLLLVADTEPVPGYRRATGPGGFAVALKFVRLGGASGDAELRALELVRDLRHPNLLAVFGVWWVGEHLAIASELAERTLLDRLTEATGGGLQGIPAEELLGHLEDAARGLDHLHHCGLQHRDVKPQNLLLLGGRVKVADFGLVKALRPGAAGHSGRMTPAYAAPEFLAGTTAPQSDQYSLAVTYCQLRGGRLPFPGAVAEVVVGQLRGEPDLSMLPAAERPVVARALSLGPSERWPDCVSFVSALRRAASPGADATGRGGRGGRKQRLLLACGLLLGLLLLPLLSMTRPGRSPAPGREQGPPPPGQAFCLRGHTAAVTSVGISSDGRIGVSGAEDGRRALIGGEDGAVVSLDLESGEERCRLRGHTGPVTSLALAVSGRVGLSGGVDGTVRLWRLPD